MPSPPMTASLIVRPPGQCAANRYDLAVGQRAAQGYHVAPVRALLVGRQADLDAAFGGQQRRVDVGDGVLDDVAEHALERG
jgi:hypothetical protein